MSAEFPTLFEVLRRTDPNHPTYGTPEFADHQAAAWREACTVRTVEQLDALPPETVIKTEGGSIACRHYSGIGVVFGDERPFPWTSSLATELPGVLLWHPDWSQP